MMQPSFNPADCLFFGVDFSGAVDAGRKLWVSRVEVRAGALMLTALHRADQLPGGGVARDAAYQGLRTLIAAHPVSVWGCDMPFGLATPLIGHATWHAFITHFADDYPTSETLHERGRALRPPRRLTDIQAKTPFAPHNLRLYRQTYHALRDVIAPLVMAQAATFPPMLWGDAPRPILLEVCPASSLKARGWYFPYKGRTDAARAGRQRLIDLFTHRDDLPLRIPAALLPILIDDADGDALDSAIAACCTADSTFSGEIERALADPEPRYRLEARVFGAL
ncbi:MAG: hypothetical protein SF162_16035 [bacterium]|nr:hypothetical protein [bacterium]